VDLTELDLKVAYGEHQAYEVMMIKLNFADVEELIILFQYCIIQRKKII